MSVVLRSYWGGGSGGCHAYEHRGVVIDIRRATGAALQGPPPPPLQEAGGVASHCSNARTCCKLAFTCTATLCGGVDCGWAPLTQSSPRVDLCEHIPAVTCFMACCALPRTSSSGPARHPPSTSLLQRRRAKALTRPLAALPHQHAVKSLSPTAPAHLQQINTPATVRTPRCCGARSTTYLPEDQGLARLRPVSCHNSSPSQPRRRPSRGPEGAVPPLTDKLPSSKATSPRAGGRPSRARATGMAVRSNAALRALLSVSVPRAGTGGSACLPTPGCGGGAAVGEAWPATSNAVTFSLGSGYELSPSQQEHHRLQHIQGQRKAAAGAAGRRWSSSMSSSGEVHTGRFPAGVPPTLRVRGGSGAPSPAMWRRQLQGTAVRPFSTVVSFPLAQTGEGISECELVEWFIKVRRHKARVQQRHAEVHCMCAWPIRVGNIVLLC